MSRENKQIEVQFKSNEAFHHVPIHQSDRAEKGQTWAERFTMLLAEEHSQPMHARFGGAAGEKLKDCIAVCAGRYARGADHEDIVQETMIWLVASLDSLIEEVGIELVAMKVWGKARGKARAQRQARKHEDSTSNEGDLIKHAMDSAHVVCEEHPVLGKNQELKTRLAKIPEHGTLLLKIVELLERGWSVDEIAASLKFHRNQYYRRYRQMIARVWNTLNPTEAKVVPPVSA